jgi:8-oxo-dGTP pyrophosphatase MutT (NUDIX family)
MSDTPPSPENVQQLADYLTRVNRDRSTPNMRPKNAATLILLDHSGKTPRVLMGKRHAGHKFMPGKFVFPGGRIEASDRQMNVAGALSPIVEEKLNKRVQRPSSIRPRALALAAIRETFEETGILLGTKEYGAAIAPPPGPWTDFVGHGVLPNLENLHFIARAITPPRRPKRFDTCILLDGRERDRPQDRRRRHRRHGACGVGLDSAGGSPHARPAADHRRRPEGAGRPDRRRHAPRIAGALLLRSPQEVEPRGAVTPRQPSPGGRGSMRSIGVRGLRPCDEGAILLAAANRAAA